MGQSPVKPAASRGAALPIILKAIRRRRGLTSADVARAMGMPRRSYDHFEAGGGRLNPDHVHRFARAVDADGHAILLALAFGSPDFALWCMDNKLATILMMSVQDFQAAAGRDIERLEAQALISTFSRTFSELTASAREHEAYVERWMSDRALGGRPFGCDET